MSTATKRCGGGCNFGTRARCLVCGHFGSRPGRVYVLPDLRDTEMRAHPSSWRNSDPERSPGVEDIAGWDDDYPNPWC